MEQKGGRAGICVLSPMETDVEEGHGRALERVERGLDRAGRDVAEDEIGEAGPEAAPPAGQEAGACGRGGSVEAEEHLEKQILREGADEVGSSTAWLLPGNLKSPKQCSVHELHQKKLIDGSR